MDPLEDAGEDGKCSIVQQLLCMACLGPGQTLHVLKHQALQLYNTTVNSGQQLIHNVSPRVCWECEILLKKVIHFRERVTECHNILNSSHVGWNEVTRPSRLQKSTIVEIDIPPLDTECSMSEVTEQIEEVEQQEPSATEDTQPSEVKIEIEELDPYKTKEIQISEVKQEIELCMGCLCRGRRLNNIRDKELKYYRDILNQKMVMHDVSGVTPRLCWECCCMLRQATLFSEKSAESYQILLPSILTADIQDITSLLCSGVSLPPRLRRCVRDRVDIPPHAHTHDPPPPVKLEPGSPGLGDSSPPPAGHVQRTDAVSDLRSFLNAQEERDDVESQPMDVCGAEHERGRMVLRGRRRLRGRAAPSSARERLSHSTPTLQEVDEASGWTYTPREQPPENPVFEQVSRVVAPNIDENSSELDCFLAFFPESVWKLMETETNRYAAEIKAKQAGLGLLKPGSIISNWIPVTLTELKQFMSIIIHMTLVDKESFDSYWSTTGIIHTPFAANIMTRARFGAIFCYLHLNDNSKYISRGQPNYDAFFKLRPFIDVLCKKCEESFCPGEQLTINEVNCGFSRKAPIRVFNRDKPDKYGRKIYMLCDAETGYILRMIPYVADTKTVAETVTELIEPYLDKWHTLYMDSSITSPTIADLLWLRKTRIVGTVMATRRGLPQQWRQQPIHTDEMAFCHRGNLTACKWKDKSDVHFLTTKHAASWTEVTVKAKGGHRKKIKPDCVLDYNLHKIGVDLNFQYVAYYSFERRAFKWWQVMFFHLVARALMQAYVIYVKSNQATKLNYYQFLTSCGEGLMDASVADDAAGPSHGPHSSEASARLIGRHFHRRIPPTAVQQNVTRVCKVCADTEKKQTGKRGRKETSFYCPSCNIPLCHYPCFEKFHTQSDYTV